MEDRRVLSGIAFSDFSDSTGLSLVGNATISGGNVLRLTPAVGGMAGAAWYVAEKPIVSLNWETTFAFNLNGYDGLPGNGADGFAFIVQNYEAPYLSNGAGTLGYDGLPNSLAIEFDTFQNTDVNDPSHSHISVHTNGTGPNSWDEAFSLGSFSTATYIDDAITHTVRISYTPGTLSVFFEDLVNPALTASVDLSDVLHLDAGRAWVGFTGATGGGYENHDVLNWHFNSLADSEPVVTVRDVELVEGDQGTTKFLDFPVTVRRPDAAGPLSVQVDFATADGSATQISGDYAPSSGTLMFTLVDGQKEATQIVWVTTNGDELIESHDTLAVNLSAAVGALIGCDHGVGTILNDDTQILISDAIATEGDGTMKFRDVLVPPRSGGLNDARGIDFGPDGNIYVSSLTSPLRGSINRYEADTGRFLGVFAGTPEMNGAKDLEFGPDGCLYVTDNISSSVLRFDGVTGTFIDEFVSERSGGLSSAIGLVFGRDAGGDVEQRDLYVTSMGTSSVLRYDGVSGAFVDAFVPTGSGGLYNPTALIFGPDGNLYVASGAHTDYYNSILRYDGTTGEFLGAFVPAGSGGLTLAPTGGMHFGPDANNDAVPDLYVSNGEFDEVLVYDGGDGTFLKKFITAGLGGLDDPKGLLFDSQGDLLVVSNGNDSILRYSLSSQAVFTISLSSPCAVPVSIDYAAVDGTAQVGELDYVQVSLATWTFEPDTTSMTVSVQTLDDQALEAIETFAITLFNPVGATIADGEGIGTILDNDSVLLFADSFEHGQWNGLWVQDSQNDWFTSTQRKTDGSYSAEVDGSASDAVLTLASPINLTPYGSAELTFDWLIESGLDTGEYLALDLFNGTSWQEVAKLRGNVDAENVWHSPVINIDGSFLVSNFQFRFRAKMSGSDEDANVDNVRLIATSLAGPPNQLPMAVDDAAATAEDTAATIDVLANDSDPDLDGLQVESVTQGSYGAVVINGDGTLTYTPQANYFGSDNFTYTLCDGCGGTDTANVLITISPVNDAPVAVDDQYITYVDVALNVPAATGVLANDADVDDDMLTSTLVTGPTHGSLTLNPDGSFAYTPAAGYLGSDGFTYLVQDGQGGVDTGAVTINVVQSTPATLSINNVTKNEGKNGTTVFTFTVMRGGNTSGSVAVSYATANGTAQAGSDYNAVSNTLSFASGETTKTINVGVITDRVGEPNETFFVNLSNVVGAEILDGQGLGTIVNDDGAALMAAFGARADGQSVTLGQVQQLLPTAVSFWSTGSHAAVTAQLTVELDDLPSGQLGAAHGHTITLDMDANGAGWHTGRAAPDAGRVDLLSVLAHEIGHVLGYDHSDLADNLMAATLPTGTRRLPELDTRAFAPLLLNESQLNVTRHEVVDQPLLANCPDGGNGADIAPWLLPLVSATDAERPRMSSEAVQARILKIIADEETELLDDELLDLIAGGQK